MLITGTATVFHNVSSVNTGGDRFSYISAAEDEKFVFLQGDVDNNGVINVRDLGILISSLTKTNQDFSDQKIYYDVNFDSSVDVSDVIQLKKIELEQNTVLKVEYENIILITFLEENKTSAKAIYEKIETIEADSPKLMKVADGSKEAEVIKVTFKDGTEDKVFDKSGSYDVVLLVYRNDNSVEEVTIRINVNGITRVSETVTTGITTSVTEVTTITEKTATDKPADNPAPASEENKQDNPSPSNSNPAPSNDNPAPVEPPKAEEPKPTPVVETTPEPVQEPEPEVVPTDPYWGYYYSSENGKARFEYAISQGCSEDQAASYVRHCAARGEENVIIGIPPIDHERARWGVWYFDGYTEDGDEIWGCG